MPGSSADDMAAAPPRVVGPADGKTVDLGACGARFMVWGQESGGGFSLVEHPIPARHLAAPMHRHRREDEYSYVTQGRLGAQLGDQVVVAEVGDLVFKPRGQWHTFWNAGDEECRILEIISPSGFEHFFDELAEGLITPAEELAPYGCEVDLTSIEELCQRHGLEYPPRR
jgi:mannose-6-phosphate isomerase-like protein (cupin superfamily)